MTAGRYMLIDDNDVFADLMKRSFARKGLEMVCAPGRDGAMAQEGEFDGIVLDLNLGAESGLQLLPDLKAKWPDSKVVVLTGYASIATAVTAVKLGAHQYLPKPASADAILEAFGSDPGEKELTEEPIPTEGMSFKRLTWENIHFALGQNDGNITKTAKALNMHRRTLQRMLAKFPREIPKDQ